MAGRSNRTFTDQDAAIQAVIAAGYDEALVYDRKPKTLTELEKLMGKADFKEKIGSFVYKPPGKPTLAPASDKREAYSPRRYGLRRGGCRCLNTTPVPTPGRPPPVCPAGLQRP